jgi:hypothetical protein
MSRVAINQKKSAHLGNRILAVFSGFGQRRKLLRPLIKKRQPKMTLRIASAINTAVEASNNFLQCNGIGTMRL